MIVMTLFDISTSSKTLYSVKKRLYFQLRLPECFAWGRASGVTYTENSKWLHAVGEARAKKSGKECYSSKNPHTTVIFSPCYCKIVFYLCFVFRGTPTPECESFPREAAPPSRRVPARVMSTCQLDSSTGDNFLAPHHGEGRIHMPSPAPALNMQRVTQGTAVPPRLPPPPSPAALNMWQTQEPGSSLAYRPTWRGGRMADNISCSAPEVIHILSLLETIKHNQDQLIAKVL
ncbi:uncharacterized protein LOC133653053 isoform X2 [Entelurus aequoreus]|uniref:uncharacterized protein LOC133653053 isoform X2 n=1 Tax=Entelurus aequoreus TaxID=161455 RepID=UPI002B1E5519|nr:uncharacterized protein LOC133653053 isoform X2 [Entelurus aequoreus]